MTRSTRWILALACGLSTLSIVPGCATGRFQIGDLTREDQSFIGREVDLSVRGTGRIVGHVVEVGATPDSLLILRRADGRLEEVRIRDIEEGRFRGGGLLGAVAFGILVGSVLFFALAFSAPIS